jgi:hypothetical protein
MSTRSSIHTSPRCGSASTSTIIYAVEAKTIVVVAVAHHRRRSGYWLHRVPR